MGWGWITRYPDIGPEFVHSLRSLVAIARARRRPRRERQLRTARRPGQGGVVGTSTRWAFFVKLAAPLHPADAGRQLRAEQASWPSSD